VIYIDEIRNLLKENLKLPEWDEKKPDDLFKMLQEMKPSLIHLLGVNLVPDNILAYMKNVIDILYKVEDMYGNIYVMAMDVVVIDFTECKGMYDVFSLINEKLEVPEYCGKSYDALWDVLTGFTSGYEIHLTEFDGPPEEWGAGMKKVVELFYKAENFYKRRHIIVKVI